MRISKRIASALAGAFAAIALSPAYAAVDLGNLAGNVKNVSASAARGDTVEEKANNAALSVIRTVKVALSSLAVIYLVYAGIMMVVANGGEESLTKQKRQVMYALIAFLFINIPGQIYMLFGPKTALDVTTGTTNPAFTNVQRS